MRQMLFRFAGALALCSTAQAQAAAPACITSSEIDGFVGYILPAVLDKVSVSCAAHVGNKGYMKTRLPALIEQLNGNRDAAWPAARSAFIKLGGSKDPKGVEAMTSLPDAALRPVVDQVFAEEFGQKVPPAACQDVEDVLAAIEPLPAENTVRVVSVVLGMAGRGDKSIPACPRVR